MTEVLHKVSEKTAHSDLTGEDVVITTWEPAPTYTPRHARPYSVDADKMKLPELEVVHDPNETA